MFRSVQQVVLRTFECCVQIGDDGFAQRWPLVDPVRDVSAPVRNGKKHDPLDAAAKVFRLDKPAIDPDLGVPGDVWRLSRQMSWRISRPPVE